MSSMLKLRSYPRMPTSGLGLREPLRKLSASLGRFIELSIESDIMPPDSGEDTVTQSRDCGAPAEECSEEEEEGW